MCKVDWNIFVIDIECFKVEEMIGQFFDCGCIECFFEMFFQVLCDLVVMYLIDFVVIWVVCRCCLFFGDFEVGYFMVFFFCIFFFDMNDYFGCYWVDFVFIVDQVVVFLVGWYEEVQIGQEVRIDIVSLELCVGDFVSFDILDGQ